MKRILSILLSAAMLAALFAGCATNDTPYVPTGGQLVYEDQEILPTEEEEEAEQDLVLVY